MSMLAGEERVAHSSDVIHLVITGWRLMQLLLQRPADDVSYSEPDSQRGREHDAPEEDRECQQQNGSADAEMVEGHGHRDEQNQPFDREAQQPGGPDLHVDGADQR